MFMYQVEIETAFKVWDSVLQKMKNDLLSKRYKNVKKDIPK